jgi:hypothetical protein
MSIKIRPGSTPSSQPDNLSLRWESVGREPLHDVLVVESPSVRSRGLSRGQVEVIMVSGADHLSMRVPTVPGDVVVDFVRGDGSQLTAIV